MTMGEYQGVNVDHPSIKLAIENAVKCGVDTDRLVKVIGMPYEEIKRHQIRARERLKKKKKR